MLHGADRSQTRQAPHTRVQVRERRRAQEPKGGALDRPPQGRSQLVADSDRNGALPKGVQAGVGASSRDGVSAGAGPRPDEGPWDAVDGQPPEGLLDAC